MGLPSIEVGDKWTADVVATLPASIVYYGNRNTASSTTSGTTEMSILRLDNMVLKAGYTYLAVCFGIRATVTTVTDHFKVTLKYNSAGTATTSSTEIGRVENTAASTNSYPPIFGWISPGSTTSAASLLLSVIRTSGAGTFVTNNDTGGLWIAIFDCGIVVSDTGVDL